VPSGAESGPAGDAGHAAKPSQRTKPKISQDMDTKTLLALVAVALVVIALVFAFRKKPELPSAEEPEPKLPEKTSDKPKEAKPAPRGDHEDRSAKAPVVAKAPSVPAPALAPEPAVAAKAPSVAPAPVEVAKPAKPKRKAADAAEVKILERGLKQTRGGFFARLKELFVGKKEIDPALLDQIEEVLLTSDVGVKTTQKLLDNLKERLSRAELKDEDAVFAALREDALEMMSLPGGPIVARNGEPTVVLMVGVNGVGKTTTIGKLATRATHDGKKVMLGAGDTFRAAAVQQLEVWGKRVGADVVRGKEGGDPGAVAFDATTKAKEAGVDLLFVDTAGRLQSKAPLMDELRKVRKTIAKAMDGAPHETLLVLDATTGQNGLNQAALFRDAVPLTGIVLTKLDGTAKGGIVLAICDELQLPVRYIGLGERAEDLREFAADAFVEALFARESAGGGENA
jgi:fused signal recognition particle receptor